MGSLARKMRRERDRLGYRAFSRAFMGERRYQEMLIADELDQKRTENGWSSTDPRVKELTVSPEEVKQLLGGNPRLGKKPPFFAWKASIVEAKRQIDEAAAKKRAEVEAEDKKDLEWKDE